MRTNPIVHRFTSAEELARGYVNLEKRFGVDPNRRIDLPADPNDAEGMRAVFAKLGLPDKPDGYGLTLDDKATDADKTMLTDFTAKAHELGIPASQAKGIMDFWMQKTAAAKAAETEAFNHAATEGMATLKKDWGAGFDGRLKEVGGLIKQYGGEALVAELDGDKLGRYPNLAKMLGAMLDRMAEPGGPGGGSGDAAAADRLPTPDQAKAMARALEADPIKGKALVDPQHPMHKATVAERSRLLRIGAGQKV